jgi:aspartyl-tRNA(Asn)/glutamyl-tRNA(Gln) amidotransferase subunit A
MIYIDDSIMRKGCPATAGSKSLQNFIAPFDATVVARLNEKTESVKLPEFGLGECGELRGPPMLCNDVFGNVRCRAVKQGLCCIRPTYGTVSRFGLIPTAASMDQIGIVCENPQEGFSLLSVIAGHDENDGAMFPEKKYSYRSEEREIKRGLPPSESFFDLSRQILKILAYAEISGNISRYDGIKFGYLASNYKNLEDLYTKTRTEAFGPETKLAAVMGCLILSQDYYLKYYDKAMKIRRLIKESLRFDQYDVISIPLDDPLAALAGLPSLSFSHKGGAVQLVADVKKENLLLTAWEAFS